MLSLIPLMYTGCLANTKPQAELKFMDSKLEGGFLKAHSFLRTSLIVLLRPIVEKTLNLSYFGEPRTSFGEN